LGKKKEKKKKTHEDWALDKKNKVSGDRSSGEGTPNLKKGLLGIGTGMAGREKRCAQPR